MCGIAGFFDTTQQWSSSEMTAIVRRMASTLAHRGPDDQGMWIDAQQGIALGHQRLSILDLSPEGHQPMISADDRYVLVFNGEIYNFLELRRDLEKLGHRFRGNSDTEVMLSSFREWGIDRSVQKFNGMFAFAVWDRQERTLYLGRDRIGEKPLYYGWIGQTLLFASELKALTPYPGFVANINRDVLALFLRHNCVPAPYSIYQGIYKLPPGTILAWNGYDTRPDPVPYWSAREVAERGVATPFAGSEQDAIAELDMLLRDAVKLRMVADVPLGAFLSGGIDSSTIVALMQSQSSHAVKTFTIGSHESTYNEARYAKEVAQHLGTDHTELYVTPAEALAVIPKLPQLYDEPFSDSSQIPTFLVSELARQQVTVALSGDGGDELFTGYHRYFLGRSIWQKTGWLPKPLRQITANAIAMFPVQTWDQIFTHLHPLLPEAVRKRSMGERLHKLAEVFAVDSPDALYVSFASHWRTPESLVIDGVEPLTTLSDPQRWAQLKDFTQRMMYFDLMTYLPDDILVKVDRATMGTSLESRIPMLDPRVVEFAWRIPLSMKLRNGQTKWLLRQVLYKYVPPALIERPKMGFGIPLHDWLRGALRDWAESLLDEERLRREGFFHPQPIRQKWTAHLAGDRNWEHLIWDVLMFQAWLENTHRELATPTISSGSSNVLTASEG